jgi:plasmid replication initiation protein
MKYVCNGRLLKSFIFLSDLRNTLGLTEIELSRIDNFQKKVLEVAKDQINESSDITIDYKTKSLEPR